MFEIVPFSRHDFFEDPFRSMASYFNNNSSFRTDISDNGKEYLIEAELPGFKKEDIHLDIDEDCLTITAKHTESKEEKDDKKNYVKRERYYGSYSRSFDVSNVDVDAIKASYNNGVLELTLPKKAPEVPEKKHIQID
jgi:HSP20 family protein